VKTQPGHDAERIFEAHGFCGQANALWHTAEQSISTVWINIVKMTAGPVEELMTDGEMVNQSEKSCQI